jgi:hypothetical protein
MERNKYGRERKKKEEAESGREKQEDGEKEETVEFAE